MFQLNSIIFSTFLFQNVISSFFFLPPPFCVFKSFFVVQYLCTLECDVSCTNCLHGGVIKWKIKLAFHKALWK